MSQKFKTFKEFYPYYLSEHSKTGTKAFHFVGTAMALMFIVLAAISQEPKVLFLALFNGYLFAWLGHFLVEKNRPATFKHPFYSFIGDFRMFFDLLTGRIRF